MNSDIIGYRQWDDEIKVEYVFCRDCAEKEGTISKQKAITTKDKNSQIYFCDRCEKTL
jgi:hypothetical protein